MRPIRTSTSAERRRDGLHRAVLPADRLTPVRAFESLRAAGMRCSLLESVDGPARLARHSFLTVGVDGELVAGPSGARLQLGDARSERLDGGPLDALRRAARATQGVLPRNAADAPRRDLPPFTGGWVGFAAYELAHALEPSVLPFAPARAPGAEDLRFDHSSDVVAFDHAAQTVTVVAATHGPDGAERDACARADEIVSALAGDAPDDAPAFRLLDDAPRVLTDDATFLRGVEELQGAIREGEIFQGVLSRAFERRFAGDPFTLYRVLRLVNPAPHMFFFESGGRTLIGSSPERLVSVSNGRLELVPIAGTRPRGATPEEDEALGADLARDEKERAEHDMLVDLARNDAGRVARVGSVRVHEHQRLVRFPRVQHLVSRVHAEIAGGKDAIDALGAAFPAGTVSGAPKVRAMQLIAQAERAPREAYAGAFGYLDRSGGLDLALSIRTAVCQGGAVRVQAGAGVVHDSDPEAELAETRHKASALLEAVEMAASPAFQPVSEPNRTGREAAEVLR